MTNYSFVLCLLSFMRFGGQLNKNVYDVGKVIFEVTFCFLACPIKFYVFIFGTTDMRGPKLIYVHIRVGNYL